MADELFDPQSIDSLVRGVGQLTPIKIEPSSQAAAMPIEEFDTAKLLAETIYREGFKRVIGGANPLALKRGMDKAVSEVTRQMKGSSTEVDGALVERVSTISAKGDQSIGRIIADAFYQVGRKGVISVEETPQSETTVDIVNGIRFAHGYLSPYFVTDPERMEVVFEDPLILLCGNKLTSMDEVLSGLEYAAKLQRPLLVIAEDVESEALATMIVNKLRETVQVAAVKAPTSQPDRKFLLDDIAMLTGGRVMMTERDVTARIVPAAFGSAKRIIIGHDKTTIIHGAGPAPASAERIALIKVGGTTQMEMRERKARIFEAVVVTKAAIEEGIVPGAGVGLLQAGRGLDKLQLQGDELAGLNIIRRAIEEPCRLNASLLGYDPAFIVERIRSADDGQGFDPVTGTYINLVNEGTIDPAKVVRTALENANNVAGHLLTSEALSFAERAAPPAAAAPPVAAAPPASGVQPAPAFSPKPAVPGALARSTLPAPSTRDPLGAPAAAADGWPAFERGAAPRTGGGSAAPQFDQLRRTPHMDVGDEPKAIGQTFTVTVYADMEAAREGEETEEMTVEVPRGIPFIDVEVWLTGSEHFVFGKNQAVLRVPVAEDEQSSKVSFEVTIANTAANVNTEGRLAAYFSYNGRPCGRVSRSVDIRDAKVAEPPPPGGRRHARLHVDGKAKAADLSIHILDPNRDHRQLQVRVCSPRLPKLSSKFNVWVLPKETGKFVGGLMDQFVNAENKTQAINALIGAGKQLWQVAPASLKDAFWELDKQSVPLRTISIVSEEPYYPWELAIPNRAGDVRNALGVDYAVGRWINMDFLPAAQRVRITRSLIVAPKYDAADRLKHAQIEAAYVQQKVPGESLKPVGIEEFAKALATRSYDLLHMACHAETDADAGIQRIHLEKGATVSSTEIAGIDRFNRGLGRKPLVFLNCCEAARQSASLLGVSGLAKAFIDAGAAAIVAPLWKVKDDLAHDVCKCFYEGMEQDPKRSLASIMKTIRTRAYDAECGEDTYAAYTFYGDPNAIRVSKL